MLRTLLLYYPAMRALLLAAAVLVARPAFAGDIDMNMPNPPASPAGGQSGGASGTASLKSLDASLAQAAAAVKDLEGTLTQAAAVFKTAGSEKPLGYRDEYLRKIRSDCAAAFRAGDVAAASADRSLDRPVSRYLACLAIASRQASACTSAPAYSMKRPQGAGEPPAQNCIEAFYMVRFAEAKLSGGDAKALCLQAHAARGGAGAPAECAVAASLTCDENALERIAWQPYEDKAHCQAIVDAIKTGAAAACAPVAKYDDSEFSFSCKDIAAIAGAKKGGSCGGSVLCQASTTGKAEACAPLFSTLRQAYCDNMAQARADKEEALIEAAAKEWRAKGANPRTQAMDLVVQKRKALDQLMVGIGAAIEGHEPKSDPAFATRVSRYRELRKQADTALKRFKAATESTAAPKKAR